MSRHYFGTDGIRGRVGLFPITPEFFLQLGMAFGYALKAHHASSSVLLGKDTRNSGYMFESALEAGLSAAGVNTFLVGPMPTPAIAYLTRSLRMQAGIVISASHNPYQDNGVKFFSSSGIKLSDEVEQKIESLLEEKLSVIDSKCLGKASRVSDAQGRYIEFCKSSIPSDFSLSGLKIVLDCANGATYHVAPILFRELGATLVETSVHPSGTNINESCGATSLAKLQQRVRDEQADLGIAFDGDGDRVMMVDAKGEVVDGDELLFIIVFNLIQQGEGVPGVVGTLMSNLGLEIALKRYGVDFFRTSVGDRYVMEALQERGWKFGGENSGHLICLDKTTTGDGIISALQVLYAIKQSNTSLHDIKKHITKLPQVLTNVSIDKHVDPKNILQNETVEQLTVSVQKKLGKNGRVLLRPSGTEPLIRIMVEGESHDEINQIAQKYVDVIEQLIDS